MYYLEGRVSRFFHTECLFTLILANVYRVQQYTYQYYFLILPKKSVVDHDAPPLFLSNNNHGLPCPIKCTLEHVDERTGHIIYAFNHRFLPDNLSLRNKCRYLSEKLTSILGYKIRNYETMEGQSLLEEEGSILSEVGP